MMKIFFLIFSLQALVFGLEKRDPPVQMKISVIIPCHPDHFQYLDPLLNVYQNQTSLPDEIVISLSECEKVPQNMQMEFENKRWPFSVRLLKTKEKQLPGKNRNCACAAAIGDLIICQDADDLPHPQRVAAIRYLFENFKIDHLLHQWVSSEGNFDSFEIEHLESRCTKFRSYQQISFEMIHNGSAAFLRHVFDRVHWRPHLSIDEDSIFNHHVYAQFPDHYVLNLPLIRYRGELSTFDLNGDRGGNQ